MAINAQKLYKKYKERFQKMNEERLLNSFNKEVGNPGWTSARASYLAALHEEFEKRSYDCSAISNKKGLSFKNKIKLAGKKILIDEQYKK